MPSLAPRHQSIHGQVIKREERASAVGEALRRTLGLVQGWTDADCAMDGKQSAAHSDNPRGYVR